ncbi:Tannase [Dactylellina cionopaga]|nr:Tannase [Dactylellina cionopaga]
MKPSLKIHGAVVALASISHVLAVPTQADSHFRQRCASLKQTFKPDQNTKVLISEFLPKGTNWTSVPFADPSCTFYGSGAIFQVDVCRLRLDVSTSQTSNVIVEVILPTNWEDKGKRVITTGNGGLNGCIARNDLAYTSALGFAAIGTNNGHEGSSGKAFLNHPEVLRDFVYRSILVGTYVGKKAVSHFYGDSQRKVYYMGCSTGGRQGLKAAEAFPELFDGILAGSAANDFLNLEAANSQIYASVGNPGSPSFINADQWEVVSKMVLDQCDTIDRVKDGVIEDPMKCRPRYEDLLCGVGQTWASKKCLTSSQIDGLYVAFGPTYGSKGEFLYPRMQPGSEVELGFGLEFFGPNILVDWFRYVVLNDTKWDFNSSWSLEAFEVMKAQDSFGVSTWNPDLSKLRKSKHKLITYHGLADGSISSENSYRYYDYVSRSMGLPSKDLDEFYRFFPISGMGHCGGGAGAWYIGGSGQPGTAFPSGLPHNEGGGVLMDLVKWVEQGIAPQRVSGKSIGRTGEQITREHCRYPLKNTYVGSGDPNRKESWKCA